MNKLNVSPNSASYVVDDTGNRISSSGLSENKFRRDLFNSAFPVSVAWSCSKSMYNILAQCYRAFIASGGNPFLIDLVIDGVELKEYTASFVKNSFKLASVSGETYFVTATLEVAPFKFDVINNSWVSDSGLSRIIISLLRSSFAVIGRDVKFKTSRTVMGAVRASYDVFGKSVELRMPNTIKAETRAIVLSGKAINLNKNLLPFPAAVGSFSLAGIDATLNKVVTDPYFADVVLLLRGDSTSDLSSYAHTATVGSHISFSSSVANGAIGSSAIRINPSAGVNLSWLYASASEWRRQTTFTLDFWVYYDATPTNMAWLGQPGTQPFFQAVGANITNQGWSAGGTISAAISTWHAIRVVADGSRSSWYLNGTRQGSITSGLPTDGSNVQLNLTDPLGIPLNGRLMEIRLTQGVARSNPNDSTCPVQSAPWPNS